MDKELGRKAMDALVAFINERDKAINTLVEIVKAKGGFIRTVPSENTTPIQVMKDYSGGDLDYNAEASTVYGIRYIEYENQGLCLCTEEKLKDYEWDNDYEFDFPVEENINDKELTKHLDEMLGDECYFESFDEDTFIKSTSIIALLNGITQYL